MICKASCQASLDLIAFTVNVVTDYSYLSSWSVRPALFNGSLRMAQYLNIPLINDRDNLVWEYSPPPTHDEPMVIFLPPHNWVKVLYEIRLSEFMKQVPYNPDLQFRLACELDERIGRRSRSKDECLLRSEGLIRSYRQYSTKFPEFAWLQMDIEGQWSWTVRRSKPTLRRPHDSDVVADDEYLWTTPLYKAPTFVDSRIVPIIYGNLVIEDGDWLLVPKSDIHPLEDNLRHICRAPMAARMNHRDFIMTLINLPR